MMWIFSENKTENRKGHNNCLEDISPIKMLKKNPNPWKRLIGWRVVTHVSCRSRNILTLLLDLPQGHPWKCSHWEKFKNSLLNCTQQSVGYFCCTKVRQWFEPCFHGKRCIFQWLQVLWLSNFLWTLEEAVRQRRSTGAVIITTVCEQNSKRERHWNYHVSGFGCFLKYLHSLHCGRSIK